MQSDTNRSGTIIDWLTALARSSCTFWLPMLLPWPLMLLLQLQQLLLQHFELQAGPLLIQSCGVWSVLPAAQNARHKGQEFRKLWLWQNIFAILHSFPFFSFRSRPGETVADADEANTSPKESEMNIFYDFFHKLIFLHAGALGMLESWRKIESNCHILSIFISFSFCRSVVAWKVCLLWWKRMRFVWGEGELEMWMKVWQMWGLWVGKIFFKSILKQIFHKI